MSSLDYLDLCRLCLVKDRVSVPIFEGEGDVRQIFLKIAACLPVKVAREDKLPKKICDDCVYKVELLYQFWNTTASAEKQLLQWLGDVNLDDKQGYVTGAHNQSLMKPGQNPVENRLDGSVMQQVNDHPNNMGMGMMDTMGMGMPMMITSSGQQQQSQQQQQMTSVPMDTGGNSVQNVQAVPGPSTQSTHEQIAQQKVINPSSNQDDDEDESEEDDNSDDECDGDDGLPVKEESEEDPNSSRTIEPTTFVNVSLACDEAGPSGLQQQKIGEMPEMVMPTADGDPKSGILCRDSRLAVGKLPVRRSQRLKGVVSEDSTICTRIKEEITENENVDAPSGNPFLEVLIKREDDIVSMADEGEELVHLNDEVDEEEVYGDYSCQKCNICFATWNMLKIHMRCVHEAIQCFKCKICSKVYNNVEAFRLHVTSDHGRDNDAVDNFLETLTLYRVSRGTSLYTRIKRKYSARRTYSIADNPEMSCSQCDYKTKNKTSLTKHVAKHVEESRFSCGMCGRKFKIRRNLIYHIRYSHREQSCICDVCGKTCANNRSVEAHKKFVHFEGKFQCKLCNRWLISQENLDTHMLRQHNYVCETCGKVFTIYNKLKRHNRAHTGEKPFVCETCGKVFNRVDQLKRHNLVHTGEKPFVCGICKETFARKNSLTQHLLLHTGAKPYVCDICGKAFAQKPGLSGHRRSHPGHHPPLPPVFIGPIIEDILKRCEP